jgi:hypothetical protein
MTPRPRPLTKHKSNHRAPRPRASVEHFSGESRSEASNSQLSSFTILQTERPFPLYLHSLLYAIEPFFGNWSQFILHLSIVVYSYEYLLFLDSGCIPNPHRKYIEYEEPTAE